VEKGVYMVGRVVVGVEELSFSEQGLHDSFGLSADVQKAVALTPTWRCSLYNYIISSPHIPKTFTTLLCHSKQRNTIIPK